MIDLTDTIPETEFYKSLNPRVAPFVRLLRDAGYNTVGSYLGINPSYPDGIEIHIEIRNAAQVDALHRLIFFHVARDFYTNTYGSRSGGFRTVLTIKGGIIP